MSDPSAARDNRMHDRMSIVHCFRAPVGGVFRHVCDLAKGQARRGFDVGVICDATTGGRRAETTLADLEDHCRLGVHRVPFRRRPHVDDLRTHRQLTRFCLELQPAIIHGHGAKGGAFARLLPDRIGAKVIYTPHGGVLHYDRSTFSGLCYFGLERWLTRRTNGLIFESRFGAEQYRKKIGALSVPHEVIHNGLHAEEFAPVPHDSQKHDFVFIGELRMLKGIDTVLQATARLLSTHAVRLLLVGDGPDAAFLASRIDELGIASAVSLSRPIFPATRAFAKAHCVVVPSHAESFPYIVLEAAAAGMPLVATRAGGIPEIFGPHANRLVPPGDVGALAAAMAAALDQPKETARVAMKIAGRVREHFRVETMVAASLTFYRRLLADTATEALA